MKLLTGQALVNCARELGVNTDGPPRSHSVSGAGRLADEATLQQRVMEAERHLREHRLWIIALVSAVASVLSALTAVIALVWKTHTR